VTYTVAFNGTALTLAFTTDRELQNTDTDGNQLRGTHVERQVSDASLAATSDAAQPPFVGTMHTTIEVTEWNGPNQPPNLGPWFIDAAVKLVPLTGDAAASPTPTLSAVPGGEEVTPKPAEPTAGAGDTAAPVSGPDFGSPGVS
jgi:hypothetical protein